MKRVFSGADSGEGAVSEWTSAGSAGKGRMTIIQSIPFNRISVQVDFTRPFEAHNVHEFILEPDGNLTSVTWTMHGTNLYVMRLMGIFLSTDRLIGKHFEKGRSNLKAVAEQ